MMDLADYLQAEVEKTSIRKVAKLTGVSKTTIDNIRNRRIKTLPELQTLEKIATAYSLTLPAVVEMAGAVLGDGEKYSRIARELELHPWIVEEWDTLIAMTKEQFKEAADFIAFRKQQELSAPALPPPSHDDQSNP